MSSRLATSCLISAVAFALLANRNVRDTYNLTPQFETGQKLSVFSEGSGMFELVDAEIQFGPEALPEVPILEVEFSFSTGADETVLEVVDGEIRKLRHKVTEESGSLNGEGSFMGQGETFNEDMESETLGHTFEVTVDEEGETEVVDVSDDPELDEVSDEEMDVFGVDSHFEGMLPTEPVEVGGTWDLADGVMDEIQEEIEKGALAEGEVEEVKAFLELLEDACEFDATGTLVSVEDKVALVEWSIDGTMSELDLFEVLSVLGAVEELGGAIPDGATLTCSVEMELTGKGKFDLETHQLSEFKIEGEYTINITGAADAEGMEVSVMIDFEADLEFSGGVEVQ